MHTAASAPPPAVAYPRRSLGQPLAPVKPSWRHSGLNLASIWPSPKWSLLPTLLLPQVRTTALGLCSAAARIGSIVAPPLGRSAGPRACMLLISVTSAVAALLCWLAVPETLGQVSTCVRA